MQSILRDLRTLRFMRWFSGNVLAAIGALVLLLEALTYVVGPLALGGWRLGLAIAVISVTYGLFRAWPRPIQQEYNGPKIAIKIIKGDIFDQECNIVVGTCDTFDTSVPHVISKNSVQGQALERLYGGDVARLDRAIDLAISGKPIVGEIEKPGKTIKYGVGAVASLPNAADLLYLLAYCEMNADNQAGSTVDDVWRSLASLWEEISRTANGTPVAIPVLGGGQSRLSHVLPAQDSIRLIALSFMFACRNKKACDELRIVVQPKDFERLDRLELQAFLSSLKQS